MVSTSFGLKLRLISYSAQTSGIMIVSKSIWVENTPTCVLNWKPSRDQQALLAWDLFPPILD